MLRRGLRRRLRTFLSALLSPTGACCARPGRPSRGHLRGRARRWVTRGWTCSRALPSSSSPSPPQKRPEAFRRVAGPKSGCRSLSNLNAEPYERAARTRLPGLRRQRAEVLRLPSDARRKREDVGQALFRGNVSRVDGNAGSEAKVSCEEKRKKEKKMPRFLNILTHRAPPHLHPDRCRL